MRELIIDSFAGGGGASTGIERALGRSPDIAINHDAVALAMHAANHPNTRHLPHNVWKVDPTAVCEGQPVGLLWASPDCKHFSKAKGGRPVEQNIRDLAWVVVRWARQVKPRVIFLENVEEFATWGPLGDDNRPCPDRKGSTFKRWKRELQKLGYKIEHRELCAADYGAPTIRKRLFLIARCDGLPIIWPKATHGRPNSLGVINGKLKPWRTAAEIIDWTLPCHSIFLTREEGRAVGVKRPLADNTMARVARGTKRYVLDSATPFIVRTAHGEADKNGKKRGRGEHAMDEPLPTATATRDLAVVAPFVTKFNTGATGHRADEPLHTITSCFSAHHPAGGSTFGVVAPVLINTRNGEREGQAPRIFDIKAPYPTVTAKGSQGALVAAFLAQHNITRGDGINPGRDAREPVSTIMQSGSHQAVVSAGLVSLKGTERRGSPSLAPVPAITAGGYHVAEVRAFLVKYYGTDQDPRLEEPVHTGTTRNRFGVVTVSIEGESFALVDIGMRMLSPRELFRAQGFIDRYTIEYGIAVADDAEREWRKGERVPITKTDQIRMCGNSVCPDVAEALVRANYVSMEVSARGVPEFALAAAE
jgi:DNA (cytosine-5)-methyltransferase 1